MKSTSQEARALQLKMKQTVTDPCYVLHAGPASNRTAANHIVRVAENQPARRLHLPLLPQGVADRNVSPETRYTQAVLKNNFLLALSWQHKRRKKKKGGAKKRKKYAPAGFVSFIQCPYTLVFELFGVQETEAKGEGVCVCVWGGGGGVLDKIPTSLSLSLPPVMSLVAVSSRTNVNGHRTPPHE